MSGRARTTSTTSGRAIWLSPAEGRSRTGSRSEVPPKSASVVADLDDVRWEDEEWLERARRTNWLKEPISVYEVHLESWLRKPDGDEPVVSRDGRLAGRST